MNLVLLKLNHVHLFDNLFSLSLERQEAKRKKEKGKKEEQG